MGRAIYSTANPVFPMFQQILRAGQEYCRQLPVVCRQPGTTTEGHQTGTTSRETKTPGTPKCSQELHVGIYDKRGKLELFPLTSCKDIGGEGHTFEGIFLLMAKIN